MVAYAIQLWLGGACAVMAFEKWADEERTWPRTATIAALCTAFGIVGLAT